ncbi:LAGLIDADG family homing endonuclease [Aeromicrobium sp. CTD01-1L150]|uniref:LAGLIDADG family homing endonuclease n=1 Tax=Aeromicrobium sp. CTD01-1L150 TaxID=3341830 RepID=UPI0035C13CC3
MARTASSDLNPTTIVQRSGPFASVVKSLGQVTLLVHRSAEGLNGYLVAPDVQAAGKAALHLSHAVGARVEKVDEVDLVGGDDHVLTGQLVASRHSVVTRDVQTGLDPAETARLLANAIPPDGWVALTLREPSRRERKWHHGWLSARLGSDVPTHHSMASEVMVMSVWAGADTAGEVRTMLDQVASSLPGFDVDVSSVAWSPWRVARSMAAVSVVAAAVVVSALLAGVPQAAIVAAAGTVVAGGLGLGRGRGWLPSPLALGQRAARDLVFAQPAKRHKKPKPPEPEKRNEKDGKIVPAQEGEYPLATGSFMVGPHVAVGVVAPTAGAESGSATTRSRSAPPALLKRVGPRIGRTAADEGVHLEAEAQRHGVGIIGSGGSGKMQPLDTRFPVPVSARFPDGWARNGELSVGDFVYAADGTPTPIAGFSGIQDRAVHRVRFSDGQVVECGPDHLWRASTQASRDRFTPRAMMARASRQTRDHQRAQSLRADAAHIEPGTVATASNLAKMIDATGSHVRSFARDVGLHPIDVSVEYVAQGFAAGVTATKVAHAFPMAEFLTLYADHVERGSKVKPLEVVVTTEEMRRSATVARGGNNWAIRMPSSITADDVALPLDPYVLGYWLGDGTTGDGIVCVGDQDAAESITELRAAWSGEVRVRRRKGADYVSLVRPHGECRRGHRRRFGVQCRECDRQRLRGEASNTVHWSLGDLLESLGVLKSKRIPPTYLRASVDQRLALLQGLMDSDGTISRKGACEIALSNDELAAGALELVRSLGIKASTSSGHAAYRDREGILIDCKDRHRIRFTTTLPIFRLSRKAERLPTQVRETSSWLYVEGIDVGESVPMRCIQVEHPSNLYLTDGFVPTHNSQLVRSLFGWACLERTRSASPSAGFPGPHNALVAFESKGEGVPKYVAWAKATGDRTLVIDAGDPASYGLDVLDIPGGVGDRALFFTNALRYAFGDSAVGDRSFKSLTAAFTGSLAVGPEVATQVQGLDPNASPVTFAHTLLGGRGDQAGIDLHQAIVNEARRSGHADLVEAADALANLYDGTTPAQRRNLIESSENKTFQLSQLEQWWSPARPKVSWRRILTENRSVVINTGTSASGVVIDENLNQVISSILMFSLRNSIQRYCSTWFDENRSVSLFSDELKMLAGHSPEVMTWMRDQGRSYGLRQVLATQRPHQLEDQVRQALMDFETLISYRLNNDTAAAEMARAIGSSDEWTAEDIKQLPQFTAAVRTSAGSTPMSPFTLAIDNFEADREGFADLQGYSQIPKQNTAVQPLPAAEVETTAADQDAVSVQGPGDASDDDEDAPAVADLSQW